MGKNLLKHPGLKDLPLKPMEKPEAKKDKKEPDFTIRPLPFASRFYCAFLFQIQFLRQNQPGPPVKKGADDYVIQDIKSHHRLRAERRNISCM